MGAIATVTYTINKQRKLEDGRRIVHATIVFGDGAATYPANGVPLSAGKMACPVSIDSLQIQDDGSTGYKFGFDAAHTSIRMFQQAGTPAHTHDILLKDAVQADGATTRVNAAANKLGANTGSDLTITGAGANGGVKNSAVLSDLVLNELTTAATPAAQTLKVVVIGY